ncbi:MAG: hypothetical protein Q8L41_15660 [Anaerolineales bacterium]|nr:hypothetical protein [Anaerolineales bacterium]
MPINYQGIYKQIEEIGKGEKERKKKKEEVRSVSGLSGRDALRGMLARLQPKEEVLLLGWGLPIQLPARRGHADIMMPSGMLGGGGNAKRSEAQNMKELGF